VNQVDHQANAALGITGGVVLNLQGVLVVLNQNVCGFLVYILHVSGSHGEGGGVVEDARDLSLVVNNGNEVGRVSVVAGERKDTAGEVGAAHRSGLHLAELRHTHDDVTVEVVIGGKTFTADFTSVYTTLTHNGKAVVSTNSEAVANGAADGEGVYLFGLTITGVPAGEYDAVVSIYGTTAASNGSPVVVCNDATTVKVTV
jgi:hypothetical protein